MLGSPSIRPTIALLVQLFYHLSHNLRSLGSVQVVVSHLTLYELHPPLDPGLLVHSMSIFIMILVQRTTSLLAN